MPIERIPKCFSSANSLRLLKHENPRYPSYQMFDQANFLICLRSWSCQCMHNLFPKLYLRFIFITLKIQDGHHTVHPIRPIFFLISYLWFTNICTKFEDNVQSLLQKLTLILIGLVKKPRWPPHQMSDQINFQTRIEF